MPTLVDDLFLYALTGMPVKLLEYRSNLGYEHIIPQPADKVDHPDSIFFSRGPLATIRTAIFLFIIDCLPENQRWLYYWLLLFSYQNLVRQVYLAAYAEALFLRYWPTVPTSTLYIINVLGDNFERSRLVSRGIYDKEITKSTCSQIFWLNMTSYILRVYAGRTNLLFWLEPILGSQDLWVTAVLPIAISLFLIDERVSINAFTPTGAGGIAMAVILWTLSKTPYWIQWLIWPAYSCPKTMVMIGKWALCTQVWMWCGVSPQVGYGLFLFVNQYPQAEFVLRQQGGRPSTMLRWERYGCLCYIATSMFLNTFKGFLPLAIWPLLIAIYSFKSTRIKTFKYEPVQQGCIRLLRLHARSITSEIECDLIQVSLDSPPKYTAISHRWSLLDGDENISVDGAAFRVSKSIHTLLLAKREFRHHNLFWIDSICIDQMNTVEKSQQVGYMRRIYEEADSTVVWMGLNPESEKTMNLVRDFHQKRVLPKQEADWTRLMDLFSNSWFERSWIIQEVAASTNLVVRYGKQEVNWMALMDTLSLLIINGSISGFSEQTLGNCHLIHALVIENARLCIENVDYMRLNDILKLGMIFKATLPVDKVFALLGIAEERNHIDFSAGSQNSEYWHANNLFKELDITVLAISSLRGTLEGYVNSRRSRRVMKHPNGLRYAKELMDYEARLKRELLWLADKHKDPTFKPDIPYKVLRPEYSHYMKPELVYALVAKTALGKREYSIMRYAGIGLKRSSDLDNLPSWAPDWTSELDAYIFPTHAATDTVESGHHNSSNAEDASASGHDPRNDRHFSSNADFESKYESIRDTNFYFHTVRGVVIGRIQHLSVLTEQPVFSGPIFKAAEQDFNHQVSKYNSALTLALESCMSFYQTPEAIADAFLQTALGTTHDRQGSTSTIDIDGYKRHISAGLNIQNVSEALWPSRYPNFWIDHTQGSPAMLRVRERLCRKYIDFRKTSFSSNAKFAHMIRTEIVPSFNQYRWPPERTQSSFSSNPSSPGNNTLEQRLSFFTDKKHDLLKIYSEYVDYTIGRKFAILDSGYMGLVPWSTQDGDIVIRPPNQGLCWILRESTPPQDSHVWNNKKSQEPGIQRADTDTTSGVGSDGPMYRLVGEAYIHDSHIASGTHGNTKETDFKLW